MYPPLGASLLNLPVKRSRSYFDELKPELPALWTPPQLEFGPLPEMEQVIEPQGRVSATPPVQNVRDIPSAIKGYRLTKVFAPKPSQTRLRTSTPPEATTGQAPASVFVEAPADAAWKAIRNQGELTYPVSGYAAIANRLQTEKAIAQGGNAVQSRSLETQKVPVRFSVNIPAGTIGTARQVKQAVLQGAGMRPDIVDEIERNIGAPLLNWTPDEERNIEATVNFYRKPVTKTVREAEAYKGKQLYRYSSETNIPRSAFAIYEAYLRGGPKAARMAYEDIQRAVKTLPESHPVTEEERAAAIETYRPSEYGAVEALSQLGQSALKQGLAIPEGAAELVDLAAGTNIAPSIRPFTEATHGVVEQMMPVDPANQSWLTAKIPQAGGSAAGFIAGGGLLRAPKLASSLLGAATNVQQVAREFDTARASQPYPAQFKGDRGLAIALAAGTGTLEAFGIEGRLGQFGTRSRFLEAVKGGALGEGVQEATTDLLNDLNAVYGGKYDPKRDIGKGMLESFALGAVVGTGFEGTSFLASKLADRRERLAYAAGVAQSAPDSPLGQLVHQSGITLETINKADDKAIDELMKRLEVWARAEAQMKHLQAQREQLAAQGQEAEARLQTGRVPTGPELQLADQVAQIDEQIAQTQLVQDETVAEIEEKASPLFRRLRDAVQAEGQPPEGGTTNASGSGPEAVATLPEGGTTSPLFRRIAEAVAASQPAVETLTDVQEEQPDLLTEIRREGGMTGDVEAGELRRIGQKEAGTTGLVQRTGLSPDEMRERMVSEGLSQAETAPDFIQEVEEELHRQKQRGERADVTYEDYARSQMSEGEREQSDRLDALLQQPENPFTQAFRRLDNPKVPLSREMIGEFVEEAEREGFDDDFIEERINDARARRGIAGPRIDPERVTFAPAQEQSLSQLEQDLETVDRRIADKKRQGEETADDWAERRRIERRIEQVTGKPFREYPKQQPPKGGTTSAVRANVIPEWMRNRNVFRMGGREITEFVQQLREEKARQDAAGRESVDRGLWNTTRILLKSAEEQRNQLKRDKGEAVPPLTEPRKIPTREEREAIEKRATVAREEAEAKVPGAEGQYVSSEQMAAEVETEKQLKKTPETLTTPEVVKESESKVARPAPYLDPRLTPDQRMERLRRAREFYAERSRSGQPSTLENKIAEIYATNADLDTATKRARKELRREFGDKLTRDAVVADLRRLYKAQPGPAKPLQPASKKAEEPPIVTHPNPEIDRKPIVATTQDGRAIVPNPNNKTGVSIVKDRGDEPAEHKFSSTQIDLPKEIADKIIAFGKKIPDADLAEDGREAEPHITIKYGLHGWDSQFVEEALKGERPVTVRFGKVSLFENDDFDVVKVDVESAGLRRLNKKVSESQPNTETYPEYRPHVTVAYVRKGKGKRYVGNKFLEGRTVTLDAVTFSGRDGERLEIPLAGAAKVGAIPDDAMPELGRGKPKPKFDRISPKALKHAEGLASRWTDVAGRLIDFNTLVGKARVEYRRDPKNPRAGIIYINSHARRVYEMMLSDLEKRPVSFPVIAASKRNLGAHRRMLRDFMQMSKGLPAAVRALRAFDNAIKKAQAQGVDGVVFFDVHLPREDWERYAMHEGFHVWQYGVPAPVPGWVEKQEGYDKIRADLLALGYPDDPTALTREWAAYAAAGELELFEFTEDEAAKFLRAYFKEIVRLGGIEVLDRIGAVSPRAQLVIEHTRWRHARGYHHDRTTGGPGAQEAGPSPSVGQVGSGTGEGGGPAGDRVSLQERLGGGQRSGGRASDAGEARRDQPAEAVGGVFADLPARGSVSAGDVASPAEHFYHAQTIVKERGKRGALVYMNDHAKMLLAAALEEATGRKYYHANAVEVTRENLQKARDLLESEALANKQHRAEILRVVEEWERVLEEHPRQQSFTFHDVTEFAGRRQAEIPSDREAVVRKFKQTAREERFHWSQRQVVGGQGFAQVGSSWAQSTKGWGKYRRELLKLGYPDNPETLAAEIAAHIAAEKYDDLGTRTEVEIAAAEEWLARYFERIADRYGMNALDKFGSLLEHASRARKKAITNVYTRQSAQSVGGVEAGTAGAAGDRPGAARGSGAGIQRGASGSQRRQREGASTIRQEAAVSTPLPSETGETIEYARKGPGLFPGSPPPDTPVGSMPIAARRLISYPTSPPIAEGEIDPMPEEQQALIETKQKRNAADFMRTVGDLWHLPKSLMSSGDISAPGRQGFWLSAPPTRWHLAMKAFTNQIGSFFSDDHYNQFVKKLRADKAYKEAKAAGLYLSVDTDRGGPISEREENFASEMAQKVPHVRWSERAYKTYLDSIRLDTFAKYKKVMDKQFRDPGERFEGYQAAAEWINTSSGRGKFHGKFGQRFNDAVPFLNVFFYAPRYAASRIQMLNPLTYARNLKSPQHRVVFRHQMSELFQTAAVLAMTGALAHAAGASISFDDEDSDFFKIRFGSTRYDVLAGLQQVVRLAFGISRWAASELTEEDEQVLKASRREQGKDALKYLRGKLSPLMGFITDWLNDWVAITGERHAPGDFAASYKEGDYPKMADDIANDPVISMALPMMSADLVSAWYNGYRNTGDPVASLGRAAKVIPAGGGIGVQDYDRPEYAKPVRMYLKEIGIEPRYPRKGEYETEKEYEARIPRVIEEQSEIVERFQDTESLQDFPKEIRREVLSDALAERGRERIEKLKPEWVAKDWETQAIIEEWKRDMEKNPVFQRLSGEAKKAAMASFVQQMSKFRAQGGKRPKPPRPFRAETVRKIIAKSLNQ